MIQWFNSRSAFEQATRNIPYDRQATENDLQQRGLRGWCIACSTIVDFEIRRAPIWTNLREAIICPRCQLNSRMRMMVSALGRFGTQHKLHILERFTPFYVFLEKRFPKLTGSEFLGPDYKPGSKHKLKGLEGIEVEHQDFMNLSFPDSSLQLLIHGDVLEHVPDPWRAFREAARVIKPAGTMLFTVPFFDSEKNVVRARLEKGVLRHLLPEAYHGNPMHPEKGSLVFTEPGWQMLDDLQRAGFKSAEIGFCYDPFQGIVSSNSPTPQNFMWPVIFRARR